MVRATGKALTAGLRQGVAASQGKGRSIMQNTPFKRASIRLGVATTAATATLLTGVVAGAGPASADPAPPTPKGPATAASIPDEFQIDRMGLGEKDDPALGDYRPVAMTQLLLRKWDSDLPANGTFGAKTQAAVKAFQKSEGLNETGVLDRADFYRLFVRQVVKYGSTGDGVRAAQIWLKRDPANKIEVDGSFGPATRSAVLKEQKEHGTCHGTGPDGIVGPLTRAMSYEYEHEGPC